MVHFHVNDKCSATRSTALKYLHACRFNSKIVTIKHSDGTSSFIKSHRTAFKISSNIDGLDSDKFEYVSKYNTMFRVIDALNAGEEVGLIDG